MELEERVYISVRVHSGLAPRVLRFSETSQTKFIYPNKAIITLTSYK